jgi:hypothetical protein
MIARLYPDLRTRYFIPIVVSLDAAHSMIALPVEAPVRHVEGDHGLGINGASEEPRVYEEWGYAERAWYLEKRQGFTGVLRALLWPTEGVVEVGIHETIWAERTQKLPVETFKFRICEVGYQSLRSYLRATIASEEPVGIVGNSRFCVARSSYHLFNHCHHYTAKGLREAGLPVSIHGALTRNIFAKQLRRIVRGILLSTLSPERSTDAGKGVLSAPEPAGRQK